MSIALGCTPRSSNPAPLARAPSSVSSAAVGTAPVIRLVTGQVLDAEAKPVVGAMVAAIFDLEPERGDQPFTAVTDAEGHFSFSSLPPDTYAFTATAKEGAPGYSGMIQVGPAAPTPPLVLHLGKAGDVLTGTTTSETKAALGGALVGLIEMSSRDRSFFMTRADAQGRFEVGIDPDRRYLGFVSAPTHAPVFRALDLGYRSLDLERGPAPRPRPSDAQLGRWLSEHALPLASDDPESSLDDLAPLGKMIDGTRIVALGEATHGSRELFRVKHRLLRFLVEKKGFEVLAIEAGAAECEAVNTYVSTGKGEVKKVIRGLVTDNLETDEIVELVEWMKHYNQGHVMKKVTFAGMDVSLFPGTKALLAYLRKVEPKRVEAFTTLLRPFASGTFDTAYTALETERRDAVREGLHELKRLFGKNQNRYVATTGVDAFDTANVELHRLDDAEQVYRDPLLREKVMADSVEGLARRSTGVAVWAHNAHVAKSASSVEDMGQRIRDMERDYYFVIGTAFGHGGFRSLGPEKVVPARTFEVKSPLPEGFDAALGLAKKPLFLIDLRTASNEVAEWLDGPMAAWSIGFVFRDEATARRVLAPRSAFDAVVYIDELTPAHAFRR